MDSNTYCKHNVDLTGKQSIMVKLLWNWWSAIKDLGELVDRNCRPWPPGPACLIQLAHQSINEGVPSPAFLTSSPNSRWLLVRMYLIGVLFFKHKSFGSFEHLVYKKLSLGYILWRSYFIIFIVVVWCCWCPSRQPEGFHHFPKGSAYTSNSWRCEQTGESMIQVKWLWQLQQLQVSGGTSKEKVNTSELIPVDGMRIVNWSLCIGDGLVEKKDAVLMLP